MPTKQDLDDAELSVLLTKAEPPKSPQHVDDYILAYARAQAVASKPGSRWQFLAVSKSWLNQNWVFAVATISVAVIAVSLSFQNFITPSMDEIDLTTATGRGVADFDAPAGLRFQPTQTSLSGDELSVATVSPSRLLAADDNEYRAARAVADELSQSRLAQPAATVASGASSQKEVRDNVLEELVVATGLVRSNAQAAASPVATARPGLDTLVAADPAAQQSLVEMLTRVLIGPDQLELAGSAPLADLIAPLISAYNEIADEPIIAATADRYRDARLNFTAFNLPESLAQLMDFLQAIE
ncbi:MAG TPA: hypothetical protein EYG42_05625 [Porticoccaceae bacterium]|jgi:hypothetical protein|nr:hypothetical protein [Porticoccaceae bacterium]